MILPNVIGNMALGRLEPPTSSLWETRSSQLSYKAIQIFYYYFYFYGYKKRKSDTRKYFYNLRKLDIKVKSKTVRGGFEPPVRFLVRHVSNVLI